tara:strand:- start:4 stop:417 length:414 start_codon:yes stop_codon:yes gene_type:complete
MVLFIFSPAFFFLKDTKAGCIRSRADLWINNLSTKKKVILSDGFMYHCGNISTIHEGAKNQDISIKYWMCYSKEGCGNFIQGHSAISVNNEDWLTGKVTFSDYSNGLESHILCVKINSSVIEYCWRQGEEFWWKGKP